LSRLRIDVWLDVACLFRTRSEAQKACNGGKIELNGTRAKPHREVQPGDRIVIGRGPGRRQHVIVKEIVEQHVPKARARELYEDVTPLPSPEEVELRRLLRALPVPQRFSTGVHGKRERRAVRRLKGRD